MKKSSILKHILTRATMTLALIMTCATAWAFKTETPVTYTVSYSNNTITIKNGSTTVSSWTATTLGTSHYWNANDSHNLSNGMTVKPSADVRCDLGFMTSASTTFTFTTSGNALITGVTFKNGGGDVAATSTSSEPGTTFTVTLAQGKNFTGFTVTFGYISGSCGSSATWSLAKQDGQYTALTIGGSGDMSDYSAGNAPWGTDLTTATVGSGITKIGNNAFNGCTALTRVDVQKTDGLVTLGTDVFTGCNALAAIVVPTPALAVGYQTATNWSAHASKLRVALGEYLFAATNEGGTAAYAIATETDLRNLSAIVNADGNKAVKGLTFRQTADITLSGTFTPMGYHTSNTWTKGTYDGGGYTISGLNVSYINNISWHGLFGYVDDGTVKNVVLINPSFPNNSYSAALIGRLAGGSAMNCYAYGTDNLIRSQIASPTVTNVGRARKVTASSGVTVSPSATDIANGFVYGGESYYREGLALTLSATVPTGYTATYSANGNAIDGTTYTVNSTDGDVTLTVDFTLASVYREITGYGNSEESDHWAFIASPVEGSIAPTTVSNLVAETASEYDLYQLDPSTVVWQNYKEHEGNTAPNFNLENGRGYLYAAKTTKTLTFSGTFNTGTSKEITGLPAGFNLVGNPFIVDSYVNKPYYTLNSDGSAILTTTSSAAIPPCHGVIVEVTGNENVIFNTSGEFSAAPNNGGLQIALSQANTRSNTVMDNAIISFNEGSELGKFYFGTQNANIYIPQGGKEYAIAVVGRDGVHTVSTTEIPVNFKAKQNGTYTLTVNPEGVEMDYLHLIDNMTGADVDLLPLYKRGQGDSTNPPLTPSPPRRRTMNRDSTWCFPFAGTQMATMTRPSPSSATATSSSRRTPKTPRCKSWMRWGAWSFVQTVCTTSLPTG